MTYEYRVIYTPGANTVIVESGNEVVVREANNWVDVLHALTMAYDGTEEDASDALS